MIECDRHGLSFMAQCCAQVEAAVDAAAPLGAKVYIDHFTDPHHLCADCASIVDAWIAAYRIGARSPEEPYFSESAVCVECMREWYRTTGLGDLSLAVAEARKRRAELETEHDAALEEQGKTRP
jgi:hypothetical protein